MVDPLHAEAHPVQAVVDLLVERHGVRPQVALDMLGRAARRKGTSVYELAVGIVEGEPADESAA